MLVIKSKCQGGTDGLWGLKNFQGVTCHPCHLTSPTCDTDVTTWLDGIHANLFNAPWKWISRHSGQDWINWSSFMFM